MNASRWRVFICALMGLAGCAAGEPAESPGAEENAVARSQQRLRELQPAQPPRSRHQDAVPDPLLQAVLADAASRTKLQRSELEVFSTEEITWSDGSLGCAQPGHTYTQALVPGYRIWIRASSRWLDYHAAATGAFVLCPAVQLLDSSPD